MAIKVGNNGPLIKSIKVGVPNTIVKRVTVGPPTNVAAGSGERTIHNLTGVNTDGRTHGSLLVYDSTSGIDGQYKNTIFTADSNKLTITHNHTNDTLKIALGDSTGKIPGHLIPSLDSTYSLGSATHKWKDLHLSGQTINLGGLLLKNVGGQLKATDSSGVVAPLDLSKSVTAIRNMFSAGGDLTYDSEAGRYSIDVEQIYTKSNFDSDFNLAFDSAILEGVGLTYNNATNTLDIDSAELYSYFKHDNFSDFVANEHIDHTSVSIIAGKGLSGGGTIAANRTIDIDSANVRGMLSGGTGITYTSGSGAISITNTGADSGTYGTSSQGVRLTVNSQGQIDSIGHVAIAGVTGITYDSSSGLITVSTGAGGFSDSINLNAFTTANLSENTNLYYTDARARAAVSGNKGLSYNSSTGVMDVDSANVKGMLSGNKGLSYNSGTGVFDVDSSNIRGMLSGGTGITYNSGTGAITTTDADIVHDNLSGFVADEHVAHSGVSITAGTGLKGGGTIASTRDLAIDSAELLSLYEPSLRHDNLSGFVANEHVDHSSVSITAGAGLSGGGTIASTRNLAIDSAELYSLYKHDNFSDFVADEHVAHGSVSIIAGKGLSGGGTIASDRTLNIDSANVKEMFSGANGISYTSGTGVIRAPQPLDSNATPTFKQLRGPAELVIDPAAIGDATGTVKILGNLQVEGTQTTINSTAISLNDKTIVIADSSADSSALNGAGIVWGGDSVVDNPTFTYAHSGAKFVANREISATTLTGAVAASQLTGTIDSARIPALATSDITSGTIDSARIPTLLIADIGNINAINHDTLTGFVADEHVAHAGVSIIAGKGLSGGGTIASSRTLDVDSANIISFTRAAISVTGEGSYNSGTGVITLPTLGTHYIDSAEAIKLIDANSVDSSEINIGGLTLTDNAKITFGADSDLKIYHNGSHSIIEDAGTGSLQLRSNNLSVQNAAGAENQLTALSGGAVTLYHNNNAKLATTTIGTTITGTMNADSATVYKLKADSSITIDAGSTTAAGLYIKGTSTSAGNFGPNIFLNRDPSDGNRSDWDYLGSLAFRGEDNAGNMTSYSTLVGRIEETANGSETGRTEIYGYHNGSWVRSYAFSPNYLYLTTEQKIGWIDHKGTSYETYLDWDSPTAARTITFPDATGTVALTTSTVSAATNATNVYVDESEDDNVNYNIVFTNTYPGGNSYSQMQVDNGGLYFNPQTNTLFSAGNIIASASNTDPGGRLTLQTSDTTIVDGDKLGSIQFKASAEASGTDAIAVSAEIIAEADATFTSSVNSTDMVFKLGTSGAATEKARLTHEGGFSATTFSGSGASLTALPAGELTGTIDSARIPGLAASDISTGTIDSDRIPALATGDITSGTLDSARFPVALPAVSGANLTNLPETGDGGIAMAIALG